MQSKNAKYKVVFSNPDYIRILGIGQELVFSRGTFVSVGGGGGVGGGGDSPLHLLYEPRFLAGSRPSKLIKENREVVYLPCEFYGGYMWVVVHLMFVNILKCL